MDYQFPSQLFPGFYNRGPPDSVSQHRAGSWGGYDRVTPVGGAGDLSSWTFTARHQVKGEVWSPTEPAPVPLLSPKHSVLWPSTPPDPMDFVDHMQNFYSDHYQDAFGCMSEILGHDFNFESKKCKLYSANMQKMKRFVDMMKFKKCELAYSSKVMDSYATMLTDVMHTIPPQLLGSLLHEELTGQRDRMLVSEEATGGALAFVPFSHSGSGSQHGCLIYPRRGLHLLNFHTVALQHQREGPSCVDAKSHPPFSFQLRGPVRQISTASLFNHCCVAVRSDHLCGVWRFAETVKPRLLQAINTTEVATCISVSPHILGEVLVASERGAAVLWTVGRGIQKIREDEDNLYFNAKSSWRWCEFSAHPRVILYADRTGVELTDIREKSATTHTLFHISNTSECRSGERLFLSRYLGEVHPFHHLITTQYSAYVVDERFAAMPMIKLDHVMQLPPIFCEIVPGCDASISSGGESRTTKILLGSHRSQEITMLQYSGGRAEASLSQGPPRSLHRPQDSLKHLPVQIPHRLVTAKSRLSSPALGLTCMHKTGRAEECICVLQLTEAGDIFYQILQPEASVGEELLPQACESHPPPAELLVHGPPQMQQGASNMDSHYSSESGPPLVQNDEADAVCDADDGNVRTVLTATTETPQSVKGNIGDKSVAKLSSGSLFTWKRWLQKLMRRSHRTKFGPHTLQHMLVSTKGLLHHSAEELMDPSEEQCVERLWQDLTKCMSERSLLVGSTVSASLSPPEVVPLPNVVETDTWTDDLSNRLTVSWQGEDAWHSWWKEKLGLDREQKVEALKRKRRREKEARRASGHHPKLSDSFSSSASCLSEWDNFSDSTSWFSTASQATWSDSDTGSTQRSQDLPRAATQSTAPTGSPVPTLTATSHVKNKQNTLKSPSSSCPLLGSQTPTENFTQARQRTRHTLDSYLSSQDDENHFQEVGHIIQSQSNVPSFQFQSSQPFSQSRARVDLSPEQPRLSQSQDRPALSQFQHRPALSQSQSQSQDRPALSQSQDRPALSHSQSRLGISQSSQPKKKSRMGF
ncbi:TATA box-binding protein-associated factor, RNA polymerase I, subunit C isoform X2 [Takifugu flavidus]|uniref:TATA box-binding protein-associated factor, RNA polymerase I, subunit C isoform X2 n=1 Tax=Takifugu flavidus TaxID=433684 RepID=UPI00254458A9|nr:TATA box-binding protein-associated factor, RNA polymerase I, subunit C isoform X2 [Takifugu flavidus]